jgi:hypothetical protein
VQTSYILSLQNYRRGLYLVLSAVVSVFLAVKLPQLALASYAQVQGLRKADLKIEGFEFAHAE